MTVLLLATGGTIASRLQPGGGVAVALTGAELLDSVSAVYTSDVETLDVTHGPSWNFDLATMTDVATQARDGAKGLQFVGIAVDDPAKVQAFARDLRLNYPALIGGYGAIELSKTLGNDLSALPFTIVLDRQGRVAHAQLGPLKAAQLNDLLSSLLQTS